MKLRLDGTNEGECHLQRKGNYPSPFSSQATKAQTRPLTLHMDIPDAGCQICLSQHAKDLAFGH